MHKLQWYSTMHSPTVTELKKDLSQEELLNLYDVLLTNGLHSLSTQCLHDGRTVLLPLIHSLNHYSTLACLTDQKLDQSINNIYKELSCQQEISEEYIDYYIAVELEADFIWVELSPTLENTSWLMTWYQLLQQSSFGKNIPIITLMLYPAEPSR